MLVLSSSRSSLRCRLAFCRIELPPSFMYCIKNSWLAHHRHVLGAIGGCRHATVRHGKCTLLFTIFIGKIGFRRNCLVPNE